MIALVMGGLSKTLELYAARQSDASLTLYAWGFVIGFIIMAIIFLLRQHELAAIVVIFTNLYVDYYLGLEVISQLMAVLLLLVFFLARSPQFPWKSPRALWLWLIFLILTIFPAARALDFSDGAYYYLTIIFSSFVMYWLGTIIARNSKSLRRFFLFLSILGVLVAIHAIIENFTGVFLFKTSHYDAQLALTSNFELSSGYSRAETFLKNPDAAGGFFAVMLLIPLGLFATSSSIRAKVFYLAEVGLILLGLLLTYSTGGWLAAFAGICAFLALVGRNRYRIAIVMFMFIASTSLIFFFPSQVALQLQHAVAPNELYLRTAVWRTALNVISAFPLNGLGMGVGVYLIRSEPYRVPEQYVPVIHPHNSYLEFAALGGIPVLIVFLALLSFALWHAMYNWRLSDKQHRPLLAGGIAAIVALCINSLPSAGWTLIPLAAVGWLVLGVTSSPLLSKSYNNKTMQREVKNGETIA